MLMTTACVLLLFTGASTSSGTSSSSSSVLEPLERLSVVIIIKTKLITEQLRL